MNGPPYRAATHIGVDNEDVSQFFRACELTFNVIDQIRRCIEHARFSAVLGVCLCNERIGLCEHRICNRVDCRYGDGFCELHKVT